MVGFPPESVSGMVTVCDGAWYSWDLGGFEFGTVRVGGKETEDTVKAGKSCFDGTMSELGKTSDGIAKLKPAADLDMHDFS
eukprot:scaffold36399_cov52-Cyclotella_meneghiniana.AAC.3